jgi:hypothetical protein
MIETLEARQLFSSSPTPLITLRTDLARLGYPLGGLLNTYVNVVNRVVTSLEIFKTPLTDGPLEYQLHELFNLNLHALAVDVTIIKARMNADAIQLAKAVALQAKQPNNSKIPGLISSDEALLTSQANAGITALETDSGNLILNCAFAINQIVAAHPVDATPASELLVLTNAISSATHSIESTMNQIANTDTPAYIASVVPGTIPAA